MKGLATSAMPLYSYLKVHCGSYDNEYKSINPVVQPEELLYKREIGNARDIHAVAVHKMLDKQKKIDKIFGKLYIYGDSPKFFYCQSFLLYGV